MVSCIDFLLSLWCQHPSGNMNVTGALALRNSPTFQDSRFHRAEIWFYVYRLPSGNQRKDHGSQKTSKVQFSLWVQSFTALMSSGLRNLAISPVLQIADDHSDILGTLEVCHLLTVARQPPFKNYKIKKLFLLIGSALYSISIPTKRLIFKKWRLFSFVISLCKGKGKSKTFSPFVLT